MVLFVIKLYHDAIAFSLVNHERDIESHKKNNQGSCDKNHSSLSMKTKIGLRGTWPATL